LASDPVGKPDRMSKIITVNFRNDALLAVERDDTMWIAIKPICDTLRIVWKARRNRIMRNQMTMIDFSTGYGSKLGLPAQPIFEYCGYSAELIADAVAGLSE
jgi:hypothetical protein